MPEEFWKKFPRKDALHLEKSGSQRRSEVEEQLLAWGFRIEAMFSDGYAADDMMCDDERRIWSDSSYSLLYKTAVKLLPDEQLVHSEIIFLCRKTNRKELQQHQQLPNKVPCSEVKSLGDSFSAIMTTETAEESSTQKEPVAPSTGKTPDECSETAADAETKQEQQPASSATAEEVIIPRTEAADLINVQHYHVNFVFRSFLSLGKGLHKQHLLSAKRADLELSSWCSESSIVVQEAGKTGLGHEGEKHHVAPSPPPYYARPYVWKTLLAWGFREEPLVEETLQLESMTLSRMKTQDGWLYGTPDYVRFPTMMKYFSDPHAGDWGYRPLLYLYRETADDGVRMPMPIPEMTASCEAGTVTPGIEPSATINSRDKASQPTVKQEECDTPSTPETPQVEPSLAELGLEESQPIGSIVFTNCIFSPGTYVLKIQK
ncbi:unnamed protein product [Notodromas monacha]|uniref:Uncharacterized protein n=1 Tax=Notodromas monacha TaxID=399045 RepID=A0A7R9BSV6_9CRUS|nr:unnamed protein product [Notodromas monacha]CAG0921110.1 unnamed protein product [Notodromas monacha]